MSVGTSNPTTGSSSTSTATTAGATNGLQSLGVSDFLNLMITELKNQDPLNPTDQSQIMAQTASLSQITASDQLTSTLDSMQISQNLTGAASMIGANITGLDASGKSVTGVVTGVTVSGGQATLQVGTSEVTLANVETLAPTGTTPTGATTGG
jgi:flagellar basal-body rod modification protein FlgD